VARRCAPDGFRVWGLTIAGASILAFLAILLLEDPATMEVVTALFGLMTSVAVAYFGNKVGIDAAERAHGAMLSAHGQAEEATRRVEEAHQRAKRALAVLPPETAEQIRRPPGNDSLQSEPLRE
jgi:hypothetical protein